MQYLELIYWNVYAHSQYEMFLSERDGSVLSVLDPFSSLPSDPQHTLWTASVIAEHEGLEHVFSIETQTHPWMVLCILWLQRLNQTEEVENETDLLKTIIERINLN